MKETLDQYILRHIDEEPALLKKLDREVHRDLLYSRMISGHLQGRILYMLCKMINPHRVLELGTFAGYSALCMAEALDDGALIHTIEVNDELEDFAQRFFDQSPVGDKIKLHIGDAMEIVPKLEERFDLVFIDANKRNYVDYYNMVFDMVNPGGYIIADNILWDGKVVEEVLAKDKQTQGILAYNKMVQEDERVENVILPIRDGMMVARKCF